MTTTLEQIFFMDPWEIQNKLGEILVTLQHEATQCKKYYNGKIQELTKQIQNKDKQLRQTKEKLQHSQQKLQKLQWKVLQKENIIEDLGLKLKNVQEVIKKKMHKLIDRIDLTQRQDKNDSILKSNDNGTHKRINISQYFIKAAESCKASSKIENVSTKVGNETPNDTIENTSFIYPVANMLKNQSDPCGKVFQKFSSKMERFKSLDHSKFERQREPKKQFHFPTKDRRNRQQSDTSCMKNEGQNKFHDFLPQKQRKSSLKISQIIVDKVQQNTPQPNKQLKDEQNWRKISFFEQSRAHIARILHFK